MAENTYNSIHKRDKHIMVEWCSNCENLIYVVIDGSGIAICPKCHTILVVPTRKQLY